LTKVTSKAPKNPHISGREEHRTSGKVTYEVELEIIEDCWDFFEVGYKIGCSDFYRMIVTWR
jgi:hypothetical protein